MAGIVGRPNGGGKKSPLNFSANRTDARSDTYIRCLTMVSERQIRFISLSRPATISPGKHSRTFLVGITPTSFDRGARSGVRWFLLACDLLGWSPPDFS